MIISDPGKSLFRIAELALIKRFAGSQKSRAFASKAFKGGVRFIKNKQVAKYKQGKKALGHRIYEMKQTADPNFKVQAPVLAPVAIAQSIKKGPTGTGYRVMKTEQSFNVTNKTKDAVPVTLPIHPMNTGMFASLPKIASQYQYFKFQRITLTYTPQVATTAVGNLGMAAISSATAAQDLDTYGKLVGINKAYTGNMWTPFQFNIELDDLNKQFDMQGCSISDWETIDPADATFIPGYLGFGVNGTADALDTTIDGIITISYICFLYKPQVDGEVDSAPVTSAGSFAGTDDWFAQVKSRWNADAHYTKAHFPWSIGGAGGGAKDLRITFNTRRVTTIILGVTSGLVNNPLMNGVVNVGGVYTAWKAIAGNQSYMLVATFKPNYVGATLTFTCGAQSVTSAVMHLSHLRAKHEATQGVLCA